MFSFFFFLNCAPHSLFTFSLSQILKALFLPCNTTVHPEGVSTFIITTTVVLVCVCVLRVVSRLASRWRHYHRSTRAASRCRSQWRPGENAMWCWGAGGGGRERDVRCVCVCVAGEWLEYLLTLSSLIVLEAHRALWGSIPFRSLTIRSGKEKSARN